jgi:hypothetical protein
MLTVLIVFVMVGVFFDKTFFKKDYLDIKEDNKQLENIIVLKNKADELFAKIDGLKKMNESDYAVEKERITDQLNELKKVDGDTTALNRMGISLNVILSSILYEIPNALKAGNCEELINKEKVEKEKIEMEKRELQKDYDKLEREFNMMMKSKP